MTIQEMEAQKQLEGNSTTLTITRVSHTVITQDRKTGMLESRTTRYPFGDPDFHLGAVEA